MRCVSCVSVERSIWPCWIVLSQPIEPGPAHLHAGQCGQVAKEAGVGQLVLSHFYPIADRYDVEASGGAVRGKDLEGEGSVTIKL